MSSVSQSKTSDRDENLYHEWLGKLEVRFIEVTKGKQLFTTDVDKYFILFDVFLANLADEDRQHYTCNCCRRFMNKFGGLVVIEDDGNITSPFWNHAEAPDELKDAVLAVLKLVLKSKVTGVFYCSDSKWGEPVTGVWQHMAVIPSKAQRHSCAVSTPFQDMAEKKEDHGTVLRALADFSLEQLDQAITLLNTDQLYRSEKCLGVAKWLRGLKLLRDENKNQVVRENITWLWVAKAPAGFCHPRSSMIGTLLEDIAAGLPFDDVSRKFAAKMHPLQYQRPQVAPSAGNIAQAEKIIAQLNAAGSLARRFARIEECELLWKPRSVAVEPSKDKVGVFDHLQPKDASKRTLEPLKTPPIKMTWKKFSETVLTTADKIEFLVNKMKDNYSALVTAENAEAPPIIQWDMEDKRNPVSSYVYNGGSLPMHWSLQLNSTVDVTGVTYRPSMWNGADLPHQGKGVTFLLEGCKDTRYEKSGLALFPENLKSEFHSIRSTIEAFSNKGTISGFDEATACGIALKASNDANWNAQFRVTTGSQIVYYTLDRWD